RVLRFRYDRVAVPGADPAPGTETPGTMAGQSAADLPALPRRVEPHGVVLRGGRWYLLAWDLDRHDWRVFRLDRVHPRSPGGAPFARRPLPGPDAAAVVAARAKGSADADRWPCEGAVDLELPPREVAPWVADGLLEARGEHRSRLTIGSWSWAGVLAAALRFDAPFTVVGPPELRAAAEVAAARLRGGSA
ncbi:YafY family protein, partial [Frigoribacterium sp. Leaf164]|uniref:helix-turn-helix transcriptional regulator n=1 Tax=Frigoribacterium sp. Leaf164 TaxID=1736282 RepID=UPI00138F8CD1